MDMDIVSVGSNLALRQELPGFLLIFYFFLFLLIIHNGTGNNQAEWILGDVTRLNQESSSPTDDKKTKGRRNVGHQQSFSRLHSPGRSTFTNALNTDSPWFKPFTLLQMILEKQSSYATYCILKFIVDFINIEELSFLLLGRLCRLTSWYPIAMNRQQLRQILNYFFILPYT